MSNTADLNNLTRTLKEGAQAMGLALSAAQIDKLMAYQALLAKWNKVYNLTALRDPAQMVTHHLLDSLSAVSAFAGAQRVLDVGAGGGLPGIVLAIWAAEAQPQMQITLVDTVSKKTAFLNQVKAQLHLGNVTVLHARVEQLPVEQQYDVITSRAFAELKDFVTWSNHLLQQGGKYIALKGVLPQEEIDRLPAGWKVQQVQPLQVPGLDAERHLIFMERTT
ncbi:16S rRNA (guanine(527)-N(7))-methyltransferase RsmG [Herbaspirillum sp. WGmk3]|jgi:16S rRNA (guanine527-N7)-methyltransferase|uniref:Ribosomal RNA small subunit methyltransferase G n=1 Tax=Herbaspirillum huttiense subsp. lycopersici TaxID=3074428 RepID=A0ABU2ETI7_9BURK|nr:MULTISPECIES: 16S rRNA (guanine(527)-N(7))-methyltransferase RsmG [Herbaspirillum]MBN9358179.1 16S rRNA (guanine(527)-N(7))-methyltransferase RsmG [Herbaspirillum huttiense]MBP1317941.1 16S rRNA (guanine527-N7)-methyltransferase [Herbaspirillum sp. 1130]MCO4859405.1 16S rRNA (guanine(527)-N(7))-methyltransferase RsmG [Herbaspirillum sp. WGmk3]MDR6742835.1 16S rRNA (guanine527-N7)-methyltransferase [Herbaspirillum sp. 1173]MDR9851489.1 16S rRNA (guanine(527)-N(7))-methyltransferase RsmG [Her